jgi:hypothetical protein
MLDHSINEKACFIASHSLVLYLPCCYGLASFLKGVKKRFTKTKHSKKKKKNLLLFSIYTSINCVYASMAAS